VVGCFTSYVENELSLGTALCPISFDLLCFPILRPCHVAGDGNKEYHPRHENMVL